MKTLVIFRTPSISLLIMCLLLGGKISAHGYSSENVSGVGVGIDFLSQGENPAYAAGLLFGAFGYLSYHARFSAAYRPSDKTSYFRAGVGAGLIAPLLNIDLTYQGGANSSAGMFLGLSAFLSGAMFIPEVFGGYQINFASQAENFLLLGVKGYLNYSAR